MDRVLLKELKTIGRSIFKPFLVRVLKEHFGLSPISVLSDDEKKKLLRLTKEEIEEGLLTAREVYLIGEFDILYEQRPSKTIVKFVRLDDGHVFKSKISGFDGYLTIGKTYEDVKSFKILNYKYEHIFTYDFLLFPNKRFREFDFVLGH
jgi:hypothetical protein